VSNNIVALSEFEIIKKYFSSSAHGGSGTKVGIGDDAAVLSVPRGSDLVATVDTLVCGIHFHSDVAPEDLGYKALAVNLSDCAAMGAVPRWWLLALTLPSADESWLAAFADGCMELSERFELDLIGGDLTRGPLSITVQALALVPSDAAITRSGARPGDEIFVTGYLGDAAGALQLGAEARDKFDSTAEYLLHRLDRPEPRLTVSLQLRQIVTAAIDVSDGLCADLSHILAASEVGALLHEARLPLSDALRKTVGEERALELALNGGDDYELCFTVGQGNAGAIAAIARSADCPITGIGEIRQATGLFLNSEGHEAEISAVGYRHF